jgi:hypothetical protein
MQTLLLVKITTLLEQKKKKTFSLRLKQIYSIISPNKKNKEFIRSVQKLECDRKGNIDPGFPYRFFFAFFFFFQHSDSDSTSSFSRYESERKGRAQATNNVFFFFVHCQ